MLKDAYALTIAKLPEGGFVVSSGSREFGAMYVFASFDIADALDFIKAKLSEPDGVCKCGASK